MYGSLTYPDLSTQACTSRGGQGPFHGTLVLMTAMWSDPIAVGDRSLTGRQSLYTNPRFSTLIALSLRKSWLMAPSRPGSGCFGFDWLVQSHVMRDPKRRSVKCAWNKKHRSCWGLLRNGLARGPEADFGGVGACRRTGASVDRWEPGEAEGFPLASRPWQSGLGEPVQLTWKCTEKLYSENNASSMGYGGSDYA